MRKIGMVLCKLGLHQWKNQMVVHKSAAMGITTITNPPYNEVWKSCRRCSVVYAAWWDADDKNLVWRRVA